jgi:hypothetical protein
MLFFNSSAYLPRYEQTLQQIIIESNVVPLTIALCDTLQLVLLLDRIGIAASLGCIDQLFSQALSYALDVSEGGFTGANGEQGNGLVDTAERGHIDCLATNGTSGTNTSTVLARTAVYDGVNGNLDGVLVRHDVNL